MNTRFIAIALATTCLLSFPNSGHAQTVPPSKSLINDSVLNEIKKFAQSEIVLISIKNQNQRHGKLDQATIDKLDKTWRAERDAEEKPLIAATLSNPLSSYLTRIQAHSKGLYTEIFAMDFNGLNAGQSSISSDFWQGDEAKFQKTFPSGPGATFIDEAELNEDLGTWNAQVNLTISDGNEAIGAITIEVNLTELERRNYYNKYKQNTQ